MRLLIMMTILSLAGLLSTACSSSRPPVALIEPSYSHMRDVQPTAETTITSGQTPTAELTRQTKTAKQNQNVTPVEQPTATDGLEPMSSIMNAPDKVAADQSSDMLESYESDHLFEMARLARNQP